MLFTTPKQSYESEREAVTVISVMFLKSYRVLYPLLLVLGTLGVFTHAEHENMSGRCNGGTTTCYGTKHIAELLTMSIATSM